MNEQDQSQKNPDSDPSVTGDAQDVTAEKPKRTAQERISARDALIARRTPQPPLPFDARLRT